MRLQAQFTSHQKPSIQVQWHPWHARQLDIKVSLNKRNSLSLQALLSPIFLFPLFAKHYYFSNHSELGWRQAKGSRSVQAWTNCLTHIRMKDWAIRAVVARIIHSAWWGLVKWNLPWQHETSADTYRKWSLKRHFFYKLYLTYTTLDRRKHIWVQRSNKSQVHLQRFSQGRKYDSHNRIWRINQTSPLVKGFIPQNVQKFRSEHHVFL